MKITTRYYDGLRKYLSNRRLRELSADELSIVCGLLHERLEFVRDLMKAPPTQATNKSTFGHSDFV